MVRAGTLNHVMVEFRDDAIQSQAREMRMNRGLLHEDRGIRDFKRNAFRDLKRQVMGELRRSLSAVRSFDNLPLSVVRVDSELDLDELRDHPSVAAVREIETVEILLPESLALIGQPDAEQSGATGSGVAVAVLDTGVDWTRAEFGACTDVGASGCRVIAEVEIADDDDSLDDSGHGTNVAAIVAGVAPGADIVAVDTMNWSDRAQAWAGKGDDIAAAIDWVIENRSTYNIVAMNLSFGDGKQYATDCSPSYEAALREARSVGVVPIVAAGNSGWSTGISLPACSDQAISVGAVYDSDVGARSSTVCTDEATAEDQITCFSQSGPKLDLLAPGARITAGGSTRSGTSMAAPHVAGAWAVMREAMPNRDDEQILSHLKSTGLLIGDPRNGIIRPRLQLGVAVQTALPTIQGRTDAGDRFGSSLAMGDFDGDGNVDVAIGAPYDHVYTTADAGAVNVIYGTPWGLERPRNQRWSQNSRYVPGDPETYAWFGSALAVGDFNCDRFDDLAIAAHKASVGEVSSAGKVTVLFGSGSGLQGDRARIYHQADASCPSRNVSGSGCLLDDPAETNDYFGSALAAGDFDGDRCDDLAIGVPLEDVGSIRDAGMVHVIFGSARGGDERTQTWHQDSLGILGVVEEFDRFGSSLAAGNFNGDRSDDLAIGIYSEDLGTTAINAGAVSVLYGTTAGLTSDGDQLWHQNSSSIAGVAATGDSFGYALAVGDFNGDRRDDLAVGAPWDDEVSGLSNAGVVNVIYGSGVGLQSGNDQLWHQNVSGIAGVAQASDLFGYALTAGDFDGNGRADLVVGVPYDDVDGVPNAGLVNVIYGTSNRLSATGDELFHRNKTGMEGFNASHDLFGRAMAAGDIDGDGADDLVVGVPYDDVDGTLNAGSVNVLHGVPGDFKPAKLTTSRDQLWHQDR